MSRGSTVVLFRFVEWLSQHGRRAWKRDAEAQPSGRDLAVLGLVEARFSLFAPLFNVLRSFPCGNLRWAFQKSRLVYDRNDDLNSLSSE
jgi:hypothetical protein